MPSEEKKYRRWFIEVHQNAECYEQVLDIIIETNYDLYAYIVHDSDIELITLENGEVIEKPKATHKHFCLELKNAVTFNSIAKKFKGAHIEQMLYRKKAYQYLTHSNDNAKEKYQYAFENIITNDAERVKNIQSQEEEDKEYFNENKIILYMAQGTLTKYSFVKRFGLDSYKQYGRQYMELVSEIAFDQQLQEDIEKAKKEIIEQELPF